MEVRKVICVGLSLVFTVLTSHAQERPGSTSPRVGSLQGGKINAKYGNAPLMFEANQGQSDSQVKFLSHGNGYSVFLTAGGMVLALRPLETSSQADGSVAQLGDGKTSRVSPIRQLKKAAREGKSAFFAIDLVGAATNPIIVGEEPLSTKVNYFIGRDPNKWQRNVPTYSKIRYRNVYPGIDLIYYGNNHRVEYDFDLAPGANAANIQFAVKGAGGLSVDSGATLC